MNDFPRVTPAPDDSHPLVDIRLGELRVAEYPQRLTTAALGSCVGVALYDPFDRRGGLAHIMLPTPSSKAALNGTQLGRFADWAIPELARQLVQRGSSRRRLQAKIAGGAAMFRTEGSATVSIGERNIAEVKKQLALMSIPLIAEDTGEGHARTVELVLDTGEFIVRSCQFGTRRL